MGRDIRINLAYMRVLRGNLTQKQIAQATGIAQKTLSTLETGVSKGIDFKTLAKLCDYLKCTPSDLLVMEEDADYSPITEEAFLKADELIAKGRAAAMASHPQTPEEIWDEFDRVRLRLQAAALEAKARSLLKKAGRQLVLKVVIDTSVFIAGFLSTNPLSSSAQVLSVWRSGDFRLVVSPQILREVVATMVTKGIPDQLVLQFTTLEGKIALRIPGAYESSRLDNIDHTDNKFLAAAYESKADYLISLDKKHLLRLKHFHSTQIVTPRGFLQVLFS